MHPGSAIPVKKTVVRMVAGGMTVDDILREHPELEAEDIKQALEFAAEATSWHGRPLPIGLKRLRSCG
jgi:uncharacterized protein (DUF433 family)